MDFICGELNRNFEAKRSSEVLQNRKTLPDHLLRAQPKNQLHELLQTDDLIEIQKVLVNQSIDPVGLRKLLADVCNIFFDDDEYTILFMKINRSNSGTVTWSELISYLLLGFEEEDLRSERTPLEVPILGNPKILKSHHRNPISKICLSPAILPDQSTSWISGNYISLSKDGCINYWSMDFQHQRTVYSKCTTLKVQPTWVTDMVVMPDVSIVCTSSTERDLRFYDTSAKKFELRILLTSLDHAVTAMYYYYTMEAPDEESKLILGDQGGHIKIIFINTIRRGPFKSEPGFLLRSVRWDQFVKTEPIPFMRMIEFRNIHNEWVRQVAYYPSTNCFISVANCPKQSMYISDLASKTAYTFNIATGLYCMDFLDSVHIVGTGGADCLIRIWNPFVTSRPIAILSGHHNAIVSLLLQEDGDRLFSMSKDLSVKIWDLRAQSLTQTYNMLPLDLGEPIQSSTIYNPNTQEVIIGGLKIAILTVYEKLSPEDTDGYTHPEAVSVILYNPLFKMLITCGIESTIITWDPFTGTRLMVMKKAHTELIRGEDVPVEITAGTFDPRLHNLLTGARNGSLKIWNYKTGVCFRNLSIGPKYEVTAVLWMENRIFAVGQNKHVTEFSDRSTSNASKKWDIRHSDDIFCADIRVPQSLVTCSRNGELIFWRLETGQPYKRVNVTFPTGHLALRYSKKSMLEKMRATSSVSSITSGVGSNSSKRSYSSRKKTSSARNSDEERSVLRWEPITIEALKARAKRVVMYPAPHQSIPIRYTSIHAVHFLQTRPVTATVGSVLVALSDGMIHLYSHHASGGFLKGFSAVHTPGDYVMTMTSDVKDELLFTGHRAGYIKIWIISNFGWGEVRKIFLPKYRLIFPFMWSDVIQCRAKRAVRDQPLPVLASSHRAHLQSITSLVYINECQLYCTASIDRSVRLWTLSGTYLGTFGTSQPWINLEPYGPPPDNLPSKIPPDIKRVASWTTLKVLRGGDAPRTVKRKPEEVYTELDPEERQLGIYGKSLEEPILGTHFRLPSRSHNIFDIHLDESFGFVPVYTHLKTDPPKKEVVRIPTPRVIVEFQVTKNREVRFQQRPSRKKVSVTTKKN